MATTRAKHDPSDAAPRRKVVFVNRFFYPDQSATSQLLSDLAFDLSRAGVKVEIISSRMRFDDPRAQLPSEELIDGVMVLRIWTSRFGRDNIVTRALDYLTFYISSTWSLWWRLGPHAVVVAKTDPPLISLVVAPVAKLRGARLVNWVQDLFPEVAAVLGVKAARGPLFALMRAARNLTLRAADMNVVLGTRMHAFVGQQGVSAEMLRIIPNWADGDRIRPVDREKNGLRHEWGVSQRFVVAYSGNFGRAHEFDTLLNAAEKLKHRVGIVFLMIGDGAQRRSVQEHVERAGLSNVFFKPYQPRERLSESLGVADAHLVSLNPALEGLVVPSKFYGIAAAGRPTLFIGDLDGEIPRVLEEARCGYTVRPGEIDRLAEAILRLSEDDTLCRQMGQNAREVFDRCFARNLALRSWRSVLATESSSGGTTIGATSPKESYKSRP